MVAINMRKRKFAVMHGSFAADGVRDFLYDLSQGRGTVSLSSMSDLPEIKASKPWDGKDAPVRMRLPDNNRNFHIPICCMRCCEVLSISVLHHSLICLFKVYSSVFQGLCVFFSGM